MSGIGGESQQARLVTRHSELPSTVDGILEKVRQILLMGEVQSLSLKMKEPIVYQILVHGTEEVSPSESTQGFAELSLMDIVRNTKMDDFQYVSETISPHKLVMDMWRNLEVHDWYVTHILISSHQPLFWPWLGIEFAPEVFLGARVEQSDEVNPDVFLLCGARSRLAAITEIGLVLKGNTDAPKDKE